MSDMPVPSIHLLDDPATAEEEMPATVDLTAAVEEYRASLSSQDNLQASARWYELNMAGEGCAEESGPDVVQAYAAVATCLVTPVTSDLHGTALRELYKMDQDLVQMMLHVWEEKAERRKEVAPDFQMNADALKQAAQMTVMLENAETLRRELAQHAEKLAMSRLCWMD